MKTKREKEETMRKTNERTLKREEGKGSKRQNKRTNGTHKEGEGRKETKHTAEC